MASCPKSRTLSQLGWPVSTSPTTPPSAWGRTKPHCSSDSCKCLSILRNIILSHFEDLACCRFLCPHCPCQRVTFKTDLGSESPLACLGRARRRAVCSDQPAGPEALRPAHLAFPGAPLLTPPYLPCFLFPRPCPRGLPRLSASFAPCPFINPKSFVSLPCLFLRRPVFKFKLMFLRIRSTLEIAVDGEQWWALPCRLHCFRWARPRILTQGTLRKTTNTRGNIHSSHISAVCHVFKSAFTETDTAWPADFLV